MEAEQFNKVVEAAVDRSLTMLVKKNNAYSGNEEDNDRLRGLHKIADIRGVNIFNAISGLMAKHTHSIYDLISDTDAGEFADLHIWQEKISDHINYLLLLEAAVHGQIELRSNSDRVEDGQPDDLNAITINHFHGGQVEIDEPELEAYHRSRAAMRQHPSFKKVGN